jgi:putative flippase GtrA
MGKKHSIFTFGKAQFSAFVGGVFDYGVMVFCTEFLNIYYAESIVISGLLGAMVNFSINRYWTFQNTEAALKNQLLKFYMVVLGSIVLKSSGTFFITENFLLDYKISRLIVDLFVSLGFNFTLQKYWVFKKEENTATTSEEYQEA